MKFVRGLFLIAAGFLGGVICASWYLLPNGNAVEIRVINTSGVDISNIAITYGGGVISTGGVGNGEQKVVPVHVSGEGLYSIVVTLANGNHLAGGGGYVEPGYRVTETVRHDAVEHAFVAFY